jgi:putative Holliday junction resolvase
MPETSNTGTYLGFDYGVRRLGVAVGEALTGSARPLTTLDCSDGEPDWGAVEALVAEWQPRALVVGRPCHADASDSESTLGAEKLAEQLAVHTGLKVAMIDERLSSHEASERLRERGLTTGKKADKRALDAVAAEVILESWFESRMSP